MLELIEENVKYNIPLGDRYSMNIIAEIEPYDFVVEDYKIESAWNISKDRLANTDELLLLSEFLDDIGSNIDWEGIYNDYDNNEFDKYACEEE